MFSTRKQSMSNETKRFFVIFFAVVILILFVSCLAILSKYDFNVKSAVSGEAETQTTTQAAETVIPEIHADKKYLFWCASGDRQSMHFAWLVNVKMPERKLKIYSLKPETIAQVNGTAMSLENVYAKLGETELAAAVESAFGFELDGYIGSDDDSFKNMINYFGGVDVTVPEQVEYRGDGLTLLLIKGKQTMKGDTLFKYLKYIETQGAKSGSMQANVLRAVFETIFEPQFVGKSSVIFSKISNTLRTDLTIVDYSQAEKAAHILMENGFEVIKTAASPEEFMNDD